MLLREDEHVNACNLADLPLTDDPGRALAHCAGSDTCLPVTVYAIPGEAEKTADVHPTARVLVAYDGTGRRWYTTSGRTAVLETAPRMIEVYEQGLSFDHCRWEGQSGRCVCIELADTDVQAMTHGTLPSLALISRHEVFDERLSRLILALADEALAGLPGGRLYAQGLSVALLGLLDQAYATRRHPTLAAQAAPGRFGSLQRQRVLDAIHDGLGSDLSLPRLAQEAGMSTFHFARVFKATFGTTAHRYVQDRRLEAAVAALRNDVRRPIADVALGLGFSSQSHLTETMRRRLGTTPGALRRAGPPTPSCSHSGAA